MDSDGEDALFVLDEPAPGWVSVSSLQCRMRELFATKAPHRAVALALEQIGTLLEADYAVMHARFGVQPLSEEWSRGDFALGEALREQVNVAMMSALEVDEPRCIRLGGEAGEVAVTAAVLYGEGAEQAGSVGLVFRDRGRAHAYEVLVQLESIVGFLALLLAERASDARGAPPANALGSSGASSPLRLLLEMVADLCRRHQLDQVAVGVVDEHDVRVVLVNNEMDLRPANPGVRTIRAVMAECLDSGQPVRWSGSADDSEFRLHAAWRTDRGGGVVASVPLIVDEKTVAIVSMASSDEAAMPEKAMRGVQQAFVDYASLLPLARLATRSLFQHARDIIGGSWRRIVAGRRKFAAVGVACLAVLGWLAFGSLPYRVTVPCVVAAIDQRVVSCPRDGVLAELYVRPGEQVSRGQLLAELDSHEDRLTKAELEAEVLSIEAQIDVALGEYDSGRLRILDAQRTGVLSKIAVVARRIEHAQILAPRDGVILAGELRERLGARLAMGEAMFELARYDGARVEMQVPEHLVVDVKSVESQRFVAAAAPDNEHELRGFRLAPASTVVDGKNVFMAEAELAETIEGLPPGVEGFVVLDLGARRASWVLTHRVLDWLRLHFWL